MKKIKTVAIVALTLGIVCLFAYAFIYFFKPKTAGIRIETNPVSAVYINGSFVGRTPLKQIYKAEEVNVRLIPESGDVPLAPYETKLNLVAGIETAVRRDFAQNSDNASGEVVSFEKTNEKEVSLAVISIPDSAQVIVDNQPVAFTPYKLSSLTPGEHTVRVRADGYKERSISLNAQMGYKLTVIAHLAKDENQRVDNETTALAEPTDTVKKQTLMIEILTTPVGYLRVRKEPSTQSEEVGRVSPEKQYELVDEDSKSGWYKIKFDEESVGWVSNQYSKKVGASPTVTPTITKKVTPTVTPKITPKPTE